MDENVIDRDISLAENDIDREGQQQDEENNFKCVFIHETSLCFCRDILSLVKNDIDRDISLGKNDIDREGIFEEAERGFVIQRYT